MSITKSLSLGSFSVPTALQRLLMLVREELDELLKRKVTYLPACLPTHPPTLLYGVLSPPSHGARLVY